MQNTHLEYLGCSKKYLDVQLLESNLECPKEQIAKLWEEDMEGKYGCLNPDCCSVIRTSSSAGLDYVIGFCITGMILLIFAWESTRNLLKKIERFDRSSNKVMDIRIL